MFTIRYLLSFFFLIFSPSLISSVPKVIVSVAPTKFLVEKIGGPHITCSLFVPPGSSPHSYEPSLRQVVDHSNALLWFRIGENFENRIVKLLENKMTIIDLRTGLPLLASQCQCHEIDTHIWLSPILLKMQVEKICCALSELLPEYTVQFQKNSNILIQELTDLDKELEDRLSHSKRKAFLVSHPAFGYFCVAYGLKELSIEIAGKEPTPKQIANLLKEAKEKNIDLVITEPQYSNRGAYILAKELNAKIVSIDPYKENVIDNLRTLSIAIAQ